MCVCVCVWENVKVLWCVLIWNAVICRSELFVVCMCHWHTLSVCACVCVWQDFCGFILMRLYLVQYAVALTTHIYIYLPPSHTPNLWIIYRYEILTTNRDSNNNRRQPKFAIDFASCLNCRFSLIPIYICIYVDCQ